MNTYVENIILAIIYIITAKFGQVFAIDPGNVTPIWIPSGIIFFAIYLRGYKLLPGIFFGAALGNSWAYFSTETFEIIFLNGLAASMNGVGDMLSAVIGVYFVNKITKIDDFFTNIKSINYFMIFAVILGPLISALFGVTGLLLSNNITLNDYNYIFTTWLVGDSVGVLLTAPLLISLYRDKLYTFTKKSDLQTFVLLMTVALLLILSHIFDTYDSLKYFLIIFPIVIILSFKEKISLTFLATFLATMFMITLYTLKLDTVSEHEIIYMQLSSFLMFTTALYMVTLANNNRVLHEKVELTYIKQREEALFNIAPIGVWDYDLKTDKVYLSAQWKSMIGYRDKELENNLQAWIEIIHPEDRKKALGAIEESKNTKTSFFETIYRLRHKNNSWIWILSKVKTIFDDDSRAIRMVGFTTDITELRNKDELLITQSRYAAMGEMISMIAHQWRQPISILSMNANNILLNLELNSIDNKDVEEYSENIINTTQEMSKTIDDFSNFFKPEKKTKEVFIHDIFNNIFKMIGEILESKNIKLEIDISNSKKINTFPRELMQSLINIIQNAKDAILEANQKNGLIRILVNDRQNGIVIKIIDNAGGIKDEIIDKIFDPYFSTKNEKNGTGLGLYMSKTIIEKHLKGTIVSFNLDEGACFEISLPNELSTKYNAPFCQDQ